MSYYVRYQRIKFRNKKLWNNNHYKLFPNNPSNSSIQPPPHIDTHIIPINKCMEYCRKKRLKGPIPMKSYWKLSRSLYYKK